VKLRRSGRIIAKKLMYGENHVSGDRAMIERTLSSKFNGSVTSCRRFFWCCIVFATIMPPAFAGFEMCLSLPVEGKGRTLMTQIKRIYADFYSK